MNRSFKYNTKIQGPKVINFLFMFNSVESKIYPADTVKMPTILTFISRINSWL